MRRYGTGVTGSRLLNGTTQLHLELEAELADWMGTEDAIVFTTGHQANLGTLGTILGPGDTVVVDSGDHASILDGCCCRARSCAPSATTGSTCSRSALQQAAEDGGGILVVVDGVFSMEGDVAPLPEIGDLCEAYGARLMVDEAHGAGVLGARGAGASELLGVEDRVDLRMGTFSKSLASCGGFIAGSADVIDFLRIQSRPFLFTASAVPAAVGAALAALRICAPTRAATLFGRCSDNARYLNAGLRGARLPRRRARRAAPTAPTSSTPIVPVLVGDDWKAGLLWKASTRPASTSTPRCTRPSRRAARCCARASWRRTTGATLDRALEAFATVKPRFEAEHGPLPGRRARPSPRRLTAIRCSPLQSIKPLRSTREAR